MVFSGIFNKAIDFLTLKRYYVAIEDVLNKVHRKRERSEGQCSIELPDQETYQGVAFRFRNLISRIRNQTV